MIVTTKAAAACLPADPTNGTRTDALGVAGTEALPAALGVVGRPLDGP